MTIRAKPSLLPAFPLFFLFRTTLLLITLLCLQSCESSKEVSSSGPFQKRKYFSGWHSDLGKGKEENVRSTPTEMGPSKLKGSDSSELSLMKEVHHPTEEDSCDVITKLDGEDVLAKVTRIEENEIEYKKCSRPGGPTYVIDKEEVFQIQYPDGGKDVFYQKNEENEGGDPSKKSEQSERQTKKKSTDEKSKRNSQVEGSGKEEEKADSSPEESDSEFTDEQNSDLGWWVVSTIISILYLIWGLNGGGALILLLGLLCAVCALFFGIRSGRIAPIIISGVWLLIYTIVTVYFVAFLI